MENDADKNARKTGKRHPPVECQFKKGNHASPGRPKKQNCPADIARAILESSGIQLIITLPTGQKKDLSLTSTQSLLYAGYAALAKKGLSGDVSALKEIVDRGYGKVKDILEHQGALVTSPENITLNIVDKREPKPDTAPNGN